MPPKVGPRLFRFMANHWPAMRGTGAWIEYIAPDWSEVRVRLPLSLRTRNYVGTIFGGSLYSAADPWYMLMLIQLLGDHYQVWDKAATIRFRRPGRSTLYGTFRVPPEEVTAIRTILEGQDRVDRTYRAVLVDREGVTHVEIEKVVQVRRRDATEAPPPIS